MKHYIYIFILSVLFCCNVFAAEQIKYDEEKVTPRSLPQEPSQIYTGRDFVYDEYKQEKNFFDRILDYIAERINNFLRKVFNWDLEVDSLSGRKVLWFTMVVILVALVVVGLFIGIKTFRKSIDKKDKMLISVDEVERNLAEVDIDKLIQNAVNEGNYRLAVRFCYLKMLKKLSEKQIIDYCYQKTNYEYANEIQDANLHTLFLEISFIFDCCWYGNHQPLEKDYILVNEKIKTIESDELRVKN